MGERSETAERLRPCSVKARLIFSIIGIFVGFSAAAVFCARFHNYNAGLWGLVSGIGAILALFVTVAYIKQFWDSRPRHLKRFMLVGCFLQLAGVCGFVAYLTLAITKHQGLIINGPGYYLTCVWCFMTWKWGFALFLYSRSFLRSYGIDTLLIQERKSSYASLTDEGPAPTPLSDEVSAKEPDV